MNQPLTDLVQLDPDDWAHTFFNAYLGLEPGIKPCSISRAAKHAKIYPKAIKTRIQDDLTFRELWNQAEETLLEALRSESYDRALNGTTKPLYQHGDHITNIREIDNRHLEWELERRDPHHYHIPTITETTQTDQPDRFHFKMSDSHKELAQGN